jgi:glycosyltransferase involved in cell wall biosynthesis
LRRVRWLPVIGKWFPGLGESLCIARILMRLNRRHRFDIVEIPNWEGMGLASTWLPGLRIVIRLYTTVAESVQMAGRKPNRGERFMIWSERTSAQRAHSVVTHSISHRDRMEASHGRDGIECFPLGVEIPDQVLPLTGKSVLAIGRMSARKGMETLIEAIPMVLAKVPDADFRIVGTSEDHPEVRKFRSQHPGLHQVQFLGFVDDERLRGLYDQCALYVSPAVYESFGLTFVEAMAHGRPVVGCAASAVPETVRDGVDGILVPPWSPEPLAGAIVTLLEDEELRRRMGASGRQRAVENYSIEITTARCESYFRAVLEKR